MSESQTPEMQLWEELVAAKFHMDEYGRQFLFSTGYFEGVRKAYAIIAGLNENDVMVQLAKHFHPAGKVTVSSNAFADSVDNRQMPVELRQWEIDLYDGWQTTTESD